MRDPCDDAELSRRFRETSSTQAARAPLYAALSNAVADDPELYRLLRRAPSQQRQPVLLFACVHALLLSEPDHELARWYPNLTSDPRSPGDAALVPTFARFVAERRAPLTELLATRRTQTNEVGRCLLLLPAFGALAAECGPLAHVDVGTSGGLTLFVDRYAYRYVPEGGGPATSIGGASPVQLDASVRGSVPLPATLPTIAARLGVDEEPIDVADDAAARWLEACVWPDQRDRFQRLRAAIEIARAEPPEILVGDAVDALAGALARVAGVGHPVVTNTWVLNYLTATQRAAYVDELDRLGAAGDLSWVFAEAPELTPELPWVEAPDDTYRTELAVARWRGGRRTVEQLATCHPHGYWLHGR